MQRKINPAGKDDRSQPVGVSSESPVDVEEQLVWKKAELKNGLLGSLEEAVGTLIQVIYQDVKSMHKNLNNMRKI